MIAEEPSLSGTLPHYPIVNTIADHLDVYSLRKLTECSRHIHEVMTSFLGKKMNHECISPERFKNLNCIDDVIPVAKKLKLRNLDLKFYEPTTQELKNIADQLSDLQKLTLYAASEELPLPAGLEKLSLFMLNISTYRGSPPPLKSLYIRGGTLYRTFCREFISKLTTLTTLKVCWVAAPMPPPSEVTPLSPLISFPNLEEINILEGIPLESLLVKSPTKLQFIRMNVGSFPDEQILQLLENSPNLTTLSLAENNGIKALDFTKFHFLKKVSFSNFDKLSTLKLPKTVTSLALVNCPCLDISPLIRKLSKLQTLHIFQQEGITELNLQHLRQLQQLQIGNLPELIDLTPPPSNLLELGFENIPSASTVLPPLLKAARYASRMSIYDSHFESFPDLKEFTLLRDLYMICWSLEKLQITEPNRSLKLFHIRAPGEVLAAIDEIRSEKLPNLTDYVCQET